MTARDYIEVDSGLNIEMLDDEEIIAAVQQAPSDDRRRGNDPPIPNKIALKSIQVLCNYLKQNKDIVVNSQFV